MQRTSMSFLYNKIPGMSLKPITMETCVVSQNTARGRMLSLLQLRVGCSMKIVHQLQCASFVAKGIPTASSTTRYSAPIIAPNLQKSFVGM